MFFFLLFVFYLALLIKSLEALQHVRLVKNLYWPPYKRIINQQLTRQIQSKVTSYCVQTARFALCLFSMPSRNDKVDAIAASYLKSVHESLSWNETLSESAANWVSVRWMCWISQLKSKRSSCRARINGRMCTCWSAHIPARPAHGLTLPHAAIRCGWMQVWVEEFLRCHQECFLFLV